MLLLVLAMCHAVVTIVSFCEEEGREKRRFEERSESHEEEGLFLLQKTKPVVGKEAGQMTIVKSFGRRIDLVCHFITMEPKSLFAPQYLDANLVLFVHRGEITVAPIYKDHLVEKRLEIGDVFTVAAGAAFYLLNTGEGQRLHLVCGIDGSETLEWGSLKSFFIGGGTYPTSVVSGFDPLTLSTAFLLVSISELEDLLTRQQSGQSST